MVMLYVKGENAMSKSTSLWVVIFGILIRVGLLVNISLVSDKRGVFFNKGL